MPSHGPQEYQHFTKLYQDELASVIRTAELNHPAFELLMFLIANTTYRNQIRPRTMTAIAGTLNRHPRTIGRALDLLEDRDLVRRAKDEQSGYVQITVTPWLVFMGLPAQRAEAIKAWASQTNTSLRTGPGTGRCDA